ncbi:MAG TPA: hypothetical protein VJS69_09395 [Candidatus Krumholzibacteria bacterium]|nr:hypothetical protein [Candidatus Krumholzibacteria bacterium]
MTVHPTYPVIGTLHPDPTGIMVGTLFDAFQAGQVDGLVRVRGDQLDILAVHVLHPGQGHLGRFIAECQQHYTWIRFLHVINDHLAAMLERRGFTPFTVWEDGEMVSGYEWEVA